MAKIEIRPIRIEGNVAYVPLACGKEAKVDAADVHLVRGANWHLHVRYAARSASCGHLMMHRLILGAADGECVDHVSGDELDNRRSNLRIATLSQNQHNARKRKDNSSGIKGVSWNRECQKWRAQIRLNGKRKCLGYHASLEDAAEAYRVASETLHGEFSRLA